ncbi:MAG: SHOCT domain-containing protein [Chloroflexota bacterium]
MMGYQMGWFGFFWMALFWIAVIALGVWLLARLFPRTTTTPPAPTGGRSEETSLEILKRRYANGELSKTEYEEMRRDLES